MAPAHELKIQDFTEAITRFITGFYTRDKDLIKLKVAFCIFLNSWKIRFNDFNMKYSPCYKLKEMKSFFQEIISKVEDF